MAFDVGPEGNLKILKPWDTFSAVGTIIYKVGPPFFLHHLPCELGHTMS